MPLNKVAPSLPAGSRGEGDRRGSKGSLGKSSPLPNVLITAPVAVNGGDAAAGGERVTKTEPPGLRRNSTTSITELLNVFSRDDDHQLNDGGPAASMGHPLSPEGGAGDRTGTTGAAEDPVESSVVRSISEEVHAMPATEKEALIDDLEGYMRIHTTVDDSELGGSNRVESADGHSNKRRLQNGGVNLMHPAGASREVARAYNYILDAFDGRLNTGRGAMYDRPTAIQRTYLINNSAAWKYLVMMSSVLLCLMTVLEPVPRPGDPSRGNGDGSSGSEGNGDSFGSGNWSTHDRSNTVGCGGSFRVDHRLNEFCSGLLVIEAVFLLVFLMDVTLKARYTGWRKYSKLKQHRLYMVCTVLLIVDWIIAVSGITLRRPFRVLRPSILIIRNRNLRKIGYNAYGMLKDLGVYYFGLALFVLLFSIFAVYRFEVPNHEFTPKSGDDYKFQTAFDVIPRAFLQLFVLLSTENFPDILLPAWDDDRSSFLYFFVYTYIGTFFLKSIILATIVHKYLTVAGEQVKKERKKEFKGLIKAFSILDVEGRGFIRFERWNELMEIMRPRSSIEERRFLFAVMDVNQSKKVDCLDFLDLREVTQLHLAPHKEVRTSIVRPDSYTQVVKRRLRYFFRKELAEYVIATLILTNVVIACMHWRSISKALQRSFLLTNIAIVSTLLTGDLLKYWSLGTIGWPSQSYLIADFSVTLLAELLYIVSLSTINPGEFEGCTVAAHGLIFFRFMWCLNSTRTLLLMIQRIVPPMVYMSLFVCCGIFSFAVIGLELFQGEQPDDPTDAYYYEYHCNIGFDTMGCSVFTTFQLLTTSNWHEVMMSVMETVGEIAALYFVAGYVLFDLFLMDIMLAITIEAFIATIRSLHGAPRNRKMNSAVVACNPELVGKSHESALTGAKARVTNAIHDLEDLKLELDLAFEEVEQAQAALAEEKRKIASQTANNFQQNAMMRILGPRADARSSDLTDNGTGSITEQLASIDYILKERRRNSTGSVASARWANAIEKVQEKLMHRQKRSSTKQNNQVSQHDGRLWRVTRAPGPWRREVVQKKIDALSSIQGGDAGDVEKLFGKEVLSRLCSVHGASTYTTDYHKKDIYSLIKGKLKLKKRGCEGMVNTDASSMKSVSPMLKRFERGSKKGNRHSLACVGSNLSDLRRVESVSSGIAAGTAPSKAPSRVNSADAAGSQMNRVKKMDSRTSIMFPSA